MARLDPRRHHLPPQERPRGLAVEEDDRRAVTLVDVGQAHAAPLAVARLVREGGQVGEALVGRAEDLGHALKRDRSRSRRTPPALRRASPGSASGAARPADSAGARAIVTSSTATTA